MGAAAAPGAVELLVREVGVMMRVPVIRGIIDRRILVNFRVAPEVLQSVLPSPFRPQTVRGYGIAGICLIRLKQIRPRWIPAFAGLASENAAHRIAVEWDVQDQVETGVYIPRRDTSSWLASLAGDRVFPGVHNRARFDVREDGAHFHVAMQSLDGSAGLVVDADMTDDLGPDSIFSSVDDVSRFFESGSLGYSPSSTKQVFDGLELRSNQWRVEPLSVNHIESSLFDDPQVFPANAIAFDNALLMRNIDHEWHGRGALCCTSAA